MEDLSFSSQCIIIAPYLIFVITVIVEEIMRSPLINYEELEHYAKEEIKTYERFHN